MIFSIFTSLNNITFEKKTFGKLAIPSLEINNGKQQQLQQNKSIFSSGNFSSKNITLSHDLTVKINQGDPPKTDNFNITKGYKIEPVLWNLTLPSSVTFDNKSNMYVAESGATVGGLITHPYILKLDHQTGNLSILTDRLLTPPITDLKFYNGMIYASNDGKISVVDPIKGTVQDIIAGLPAGGDHKTNQIAFGRDGRMYFGQGSATNSGVVGIDNGLPDLGWLENAPQIHDVPAKTITLAGQNFNTPNILAPGPKNITFKGFSNYENFIVKVTNSTLNPTAGNKSNSISKNIINNTDLVNVTTGAFKSFGNSTAKGEKITGNMMCNACILSTRPDGTDLKIVAWGVRDPEGLAFDKDGKLLVTVQGDDERGSRPIANDHDRIYKIDINNTTEIGKFYGWPDYAFAGNKSNNTEMPVTNPIFHSDRNNKSLGLLIQNPPQIEKKVFSDAGWGSIIMQAAVLKNNISNGNNTNATDNKFGFADKAFFAERGSYAPITKTTSNKGSMESVFENNNTIIGQVVPETNNTIGQKIVMMDTKTGQLGDFISLKKPDPMFRPIGLTFSNDDSAMYIASIGKQEARST
ncbi:MAG: hypothetical protein ACTHJ7_00900, partial [Candidatus Nitrosocosmicus sp.]